MAVNAPYNPKPSTSLGYLAHDPSSYIQTSTRVPLVPKPVGLLTRVDVGNPGVVGETGHTFPAALAKGSNSLIPRTIS